MIVLSGKIQKIKYGYMDKKCFIVHDNSFIDYPYGVFINGSTYGSSHLITPQPATYSLFSITAGSYLLLSQSDYMSIMSLVISY